MTSRQEFVVRYNGSRGAVHDVGATARYTDFIKICPDARFGGALASTVPPRMSATTVAEPETAHDVGRAAVTVAALGVVFGDIGTSPIYTLQTVFNPEDPHPVAVSQANLLGVTSMIFWSVMLIVTITYVLLVMRADNEGE